MKYVLLLLGIVLVLVGALSIYSGYGIIEVERGWSSVIAGATALTGGVITIALALILRSLDRLRSGLEGAEVRLAQRDAKAASEPASSEPAPSVVPPAPATSPLSAVGQPREGLLFGPVRARAETAEAEIVGLESEPPAARPAAAVVPMAPETADSSAKAPLSRTASAFANAAAKASSERRTEPSVGELWRRVGVNLDAARSANPADGPEATLQPKNVAPDHQAEAHGSGAPAIEPADWLDQALASLDTSMGPKSPDTAEQPPPLAPNSPPDRPGPPPEVVGRYEAEGTAYVMYADGSIEAQTERGIMRFRSMAELQAFFQS